MIQGILLVLLILFIYYYIISQTEHFTMLKSTLKSDYYMDSLESSYTGKSCKNNFTKLNEKDNTVLQDTIQILNTKDPILFKKQDHCLIKADKLCQRTDPMLYLPDRTYFPFRWIGPYKNTPLIKNTNLNCFNKMYNCCQSGF